MNEKDLTHIDIPLPSGNQEQIESRLVEGLLKLCDYFETKYLKDGDNEGLRQTREYRELLKTNPLSVVKWQ